MKTFWSVRKLSIWRLIEGHWNEMRGSLYRPFLHSIPSRDKLFMRSWEGYFGANFPSCAATREINTKITLEWAHKQFVTRVHKLCYLLHDITNPKITLKTRIFTSSPCLTRSLYTLLMTSQSIDDDVTMTRQLRREHVTSDIWLVRYRFYSRRYSRPVL